MKYIRTYDDIISFYGVGEDRITDYPEEKFLYISGKNSTLYWRKIQYVKQADTIKELCDEFVVADRDTHRGRYTVRDDSDLKEIYEKIGDIFGAIWITGEQGEPILKSVAMMNEEGELELLV